MTKAIKRSALLAGALVLVLGLSGCVTLFLPPEPAKTSTPTGENVSAELQPFYSQILVWSKCEQTFQCATATAPMDWSNPSGKTIKLALIRKVASGTRLGSLLVNPGGPGGSGYDFIRDSLSYAVSSRLSASYDIVGFDPRGVNKSTAVSCYSSPSEMDAYLFDIPKGKAGSDPWINEIEKSNAEFGQACLKHTGELLGFVDTVSAARDLDLLRATLGDATLNYLGYSYGTFLGATYAELFPKKTGHLVLDGAIDPATSDFDVTATQAQGFESAARAYIADCLTGKDCPFTGSVDSAMKRIRALLDRLDLSPLRASDGRQLGSAAMFNAIILPLYSQSNWKYLNDLFADVMKGQADYAFQLADAYYGRNADGSYADNSTEAFIAINCLDYISTSSRATLQKEAAELSTLAPTFGPQMAYGGTSCDQWPFRATRVRGPIAAAGSAPILVIGTTNDPATPYRWAKNLAGELENGHLVTYNGEGHTAYNKSNSCVNDAVDNFFIGGTVPATDPNC
ncbi:MAG: alpha/beta hydrolase [Terrimesophilobacter sp.]